MSRHGAPVRVRHRMPSINCRRVHVGGRLISQDIRRGDSQESEQPQESQQEIEDGMAEKSKEFAAAGNRVYLPIAE
ncbi:hypothetical protein ACH492_37875 [Streptomyces sp. NPDC019443]|uniref:hypothetical protein n=1 Tax=Streptomyces sp. NPDC019443 TaxID=3365061 RepID=UPI00379F9332